MLNLKKKSTESASSTASLFLKSDLDPNCRCTFIVPEPVSFTMLSEIFMELISRSSIFSIVVCVERPSISLGKSFSKSHILFDLTLQN